MSKNEITAEVLVAEMHRCAGGSSIPLPTGGALSAADHWLRAKEAYDALLGSEEVGSGLKIEYVDGRTEMIPPPSVSDQPVPFTMPEPLTEHMIDTMIAALMDAHRISVAGLGRDPDRYQSAYTLAAKALVRCRAVPAAHRPAVGVIDKYTKCYGRFDSGGNFVLASAQYPAVGRGEYVVDGVFAVQDHM